jgi:hypothetical protein
LCLRSQLARLFSWWQRTLNLKAQQVRLSLIAWFFWFLLIAAVDLL